MQHFSGDTLGLPSPEVHIMRRNFLGFTLTILLASIGTAMAGDGYRVVFVDGSWVEASEKPEVTGGNAHIRLLNDQLVEVTDARIDWDRSGAWEKPEAAEPKSEYPARWGTGRLGGTTIDNSSLASARELPAGTVTMEGSAPARAPRQVEAPPPVPEITVDDRIYYLREQLAALDWKIQTLSQRKYQLERRAQSWWNLDEARPLRDDADRLWEQIQDLEVEQDRLFGELKDLMR
jgi:hypothetical protein